MEVSGEVADLVVKEGLQATESAVKLAASGMKNVAALLLAISREDFKVVGKANVRRLAKEPDAPTVARIKVEDMKQFHSLAKEYGVLYFIAKKKGVESDTLDVISTEKYAANLNAVFQAMGYPIPSKEAKEEESPKKARSRAPREISSKERGSGSTPSLERTDIEPRSQRPSVKRHLEALAATSNTTRPGPTRTHEKTR